MSDQYDIFTEVTSEEYEDHSAPVLAGDFFGKPSAAVPPPSSASSSSLPKKQDGFIPSNLAVEDDRNASRFSFQVINPTPVGNYVTYTVVCKTTADGWTRNEITKPRRFSDFLWLYNQFKKVEKCTIVPPIPDKSLSVFGSGFEAAFLEARRRELARFMKRVGAHPILSNSSALKKFMFDDTLVDEPEKAATSSSSSSSSSSSGGGWFSSILGSISTISITKPVEVDDWFEGKAKYYDTLEDLLEKMAANASQHVASQRASVTRSTELQYLCELVAAAESGSSSAGNKKVASSLHTLKETVAQSVILDGELADSLQDNWELDLKDSVKYISEVKALFSYRLDLLGKYQGTSNSAAQKREKLERMPITNPDYAKMQKEVEDANEAEANAKSAFETSSEKCKSEIILFEVTRMREVRSRLSTFAQMHLNHTVRSADLWKTLLNDVQE